MNKLCYRIVCNSLGQLVAVAETARSLKEGRQSAQKSAGGPKMKTTCMSCWQHLSAVTLALFALTHTAVAQVIADPQAAAAQRPIVLRDAAGNVSVNIRTPSPAGISRNVYSQFDVQGNGVTLNNVRGSNPYIVAPAKIILNEINSSAVTQLAGPISVRGTAADVVIANPSGIFVGGASFTNVGRAILTTGRPVLEAGALTGIEVRQGLVSVGAAGLNAPGAQSLEIYARRVNAEGKITGNVISVVTGPQRLDMVSGRLTSIAAGTDTKPQIAIDTAQLGGMYANRIMLLATEDGTGVRNRGTLLANGTEGQLVITADGLLENHGQVKGAVVSLATVQGDIANNGSEQASKFLTMSSGRDIKFWGSGAEQEQGSDILVSAARNIDFWSDAKLTSFKPGGRLSLTAGDWIRLSGRVGAVGEVQLAADGQLSMNGATLTSGVSVVAVAGGGLFSGATKISGPRVHLETGAVFSSATADLRVDAGAIAGSSQTTLISSGNLTVNNLGNPGVGGGGNVHLQAAKDLTIAAGGNVSAVKDLTLSAGAALKLGATEGTTATNGQVVRLTAGGDAQLTGGSVSMTGSVISAAGAASIDALTGSAELTALANAKGSAHDLVRISAGKDLTVSAYLGNVKAAGLVGTGTNILLLSNGTTSIDRVEDKTATKTTSVGSSLVAREDLTIGSISTDKQVLARNAELKAAGVVRISGNGSVYLGAGTNESKATNGTVTVVPVSTTIEGRHVVVQGGSVQTDAVRIQAKAGDIQIIANKGAAALSSHTGVGAQLSASGSIAVHGQTQLIQLGTTANAGGSYSGTSATGTINTLNAVITAKDVVSFASKGGLSHTGGSQTGGAISEYTETGLLSLFDAHLRATFTVGKESAALSGKISIESGANLTIDAKTTFDARTDLSLVRGIGDMVLTPAGAARGTVTADQLKAGRDLTLATRNGSLLLSGATGGLGLGSSARVSLSVNGSLNLFGDSVKLQGSQISAGGTVGITATKGDLQVDANLVTNVAGLGAANTQWDSALIKGAQVNLRAAGNIGLNAAKVTSPGAVSILSGGNAVVAGEHATVSTVTPIADGDITRENHILVRSSISGERGVSIGAVGGSLVLNATDVSAKFGPVKLQALGDVVLEAAQNHWMTNTYTNRKSCSFWRCKRTITNIHEESLLADPVTLFGQGLELKAGNSVKTYASRLKSGGNLRIEAGDEALYYAVWDQTDYSISVSKKLSSFGIKFKDSSTNNSRSTLDGQVTQLQSRGSITSFSGGNTLLQGTLAEYGTTATFNVGTGEKPRADARIILEGVKSSVTQTRSRQSDYVVWRELVNQGSISETLRIPIFNGPSYPIFIGPVLAQLPAGEFKTQIQALSKQPGMGYLTDLTTRNDVKWQEVKLAFESWNYTQQGLTPAGAALLSAAVAWATNGLGSGLLGASGLGGSVSTGLFAEVANTAANAAFTSLASQASIALVTNKGNISKTLKELSGSSTLRKTLSAALTAGAMDFVRGLDVMKELRNSASFNQSITFALSDVGTRAISNLASGNDPRSAIKSAILSTAVDSANTLAASKLDLGNANYLTEKIYKALEGCASQAALSGTSACAGGGIGAAVGSIVSEELRPANGRAYTLVEMQNAIAVGKIVAGTIAAYSGANTNAAISSAEMILKTAWVSADDRTISTAGRPLTADEIKTARSVFGNKINYDLVRVINGKFVWTQHSDYFVTPDGNIYWPNACRDLTKCNDGKLAGTFIHEMTHVMQKQSGTNVLLRGIFYQSAKFASLGLYDPYALTTISANKYDSYNMEQQGEYYRIIFENRN